MSTDELLVKALRLPRDQRARVAAELLYGGKDLDDLQAVVDGLKAMPHVDGGRIGIWGSSYGGLLSVYALLKRPGVYAGAVLSTGTWTVERSRLFSDRDKADRAGATIPALRMSLT